VYNITSLFSSVFFKYLLQAPEGKIAFRKKTGQPGVFLTAKSEKEYAKDARGYAKYATKNALRLFPLTKILLKVE